MTADVALPDLFVLDVNETLSDLSPLREAFAEVGLAEHEVEPWFAGVLRDGFALTVLGENPDFADLAGSALRVRLPGGGGARDLDDAVRHVLGRFRKLAPHPDVEPGLHALAAAGCRIVTLSNGSADVARALLAETEAGPVIEQYLSVSDADAWKPAAAAYEHALRVTGVAADRAMLVAVHPWDIAGAQRAGLRTAWLSRTAAGYPHHFPRADVEAATLADLAEMFGD